MTEAVPQNLSGTRCLVEGKDDGTPIVLIHGVGMDLFMWDAVAAELRQSYRVIRYDMQGHAGSAKPAGPYSLADYVAQLDRLSDDLKLDRFHLVGFSMGGLVAQGYAVGHPNRVDHLVVVNTVYNRTPDERAAITARVADVRNGGYPASVEAAIDRWFTPDFRRDHGATVEAVRKRMLGNDLEPYANAYAVFGSADAELVESVAEIHSPTLVITGSDDQRSTAAMARALAARLPQGRLEIIAGQRHLTPLEVPGQLAASIRNFITGPHAARAAS
ncbi:alpha/beta fold hydrolase [Dongia soli]|uniref:Alpha/beta fold hydrolase n=1 Tax=Dongia soli TaxID=600628 RepID=A0ABU5EGV0_9PROT|nr:alpha/beta fold hydrolase [Dongia soli]MDY0885507.1 alpha/beta fold hydrolase [Dongia soli]